MTSKSPLLLSSSFCFCSSFFALLSCCFPSTEARWPIRDRDRVGRGRQSEGSTAETIRKRPERLWTAARTMEVLRRCPLTSAQQLVHCTIAVSTAVLDRVTKTMSVALLLTNNLDNSKQKMSNLLSPAPPPYSWSLLRKVEGPAPPPSSKISWSLDLTWNPAAILTLSALLNLAWKPFSLKTHTFLQSHCPDEYAFMLYALNLDNMWL